MQFLRRLQGNKFSHSLLLLFISAFLVRLIALDQSLWLDEAITANVVQSSFSDILTQFSPVDFHPPLYYWMLKLWSTFFGSSEVALRSLSVLLSLIAGYFIYRVGRLVRDERVGLWSAAFFLFNPLVIYYSQEARMYVLATMLIALHLWSLLELKNKWTTKWALVFAGSLALSFLTFYGTVFYFGAVGLYALWLRQWKLAWLTAGSFVVTVLVGSPLLVKQFVHSREMLAVVTNWHSVLGTANMKNLLLIPIKLTSGRISFEPKIVYYTLSVVWLAIVGIIAALGRRQRMLIWLLVAPLALGVVFSFFSPLLQYFRFIYLIIPFSVLLAVGTLRYQIARPFVLLGFVTWSLVYLLLPQFHREDWRSVSYVINESDTPVYLIISSSDPLRYYLRNRELHSLQEFKLEGAPGEILVIPYTAEIHGFPYSEVLTQLGYSIQETSAFRGITVERWNQPH